MVEKVASNVWRVGGGPWALKDITVLSADTDCNVYLLKLGDANVMVDTGSTPGQDAIEANLRECGVESKDISALILTHSHFDHTECAHRWQQAYGVRVYFNSVGTAYMARGDYRLVGHQASEPGCVFEPFTVDHACEDGETFEIGDELFDVASDLVIEFSLKDGKATGFEIRGEDDQVIGTGVRTK